MNKGLFVAIIHELCRVDFLSYRVNNHYIICISLYFARNDIIIIIALHMIRLVLNALIYGVSDYREIYICSSVVAKIMTTISQ